MPKNSGCPAPWATGTGAIHLAARQYGAPTASLNEALRLCQETGNRLGEADSRHVIGAVQLAAGEYSQAEASLNQALNLYTNLGVRHGQAEVLNSTGELLLAYSDHVQALSHFRRALAIASSIDLRTEEVRAQAGISQCGQDAEPAL